MGKNLSFLQFTSIFIGFLGILDLQGAQSAKNFGKQTLRRIGRTLKPRLGTGKSSNPLLSQYIKQPFQSKFSKYFIDQLPIDQSSPYDLSKHFNPEHVQLEQAPLLPQPSGILDLLKENIAKTFQLQEQESATSTNDNTKHDNTNNNQIHVVKKIYNEAPRFNMPLYTPMHNIAPAPQQEPRTEMDAYIAPKHHIPDYQPQGIDSVALPTHNFHLIHNQDEGTLLVSEQGGALTETQGVIIEIPEHQNMAHNTQHSARKFLKIDLSNLETAYQAFKDFLQDPMFTESTCTLPVNVYQQENGTLSITPTAITVLFNRAKPNTLALFHEGKRLGATIDLEQLSLTLKHDQHNDHTLSYDKQPMLEYQPPHQSASPDTIEHILLPAEPSTPQIITDQTSSPPEASLYRPTIVHQPPMQQQSVAAEVSPSQHMAMQKTPVTKLSPHIKDLSTSLQTPKAMLPVQLSPLRPSDIAQEQPTPLVTYATTTDVPTATLKKSDQPARAQHENLQRLFTAAGPSYAAIQYATSEKEHAKSPKTPGAPHGKEAPDTQPVIPKNITDQSTLPTPKSKAATSYSTPQPTPQPLQQNKAIQKQQEAPAPSLSPKNPHSYSPRLASSLPTNKAIDNQPVSQPLHNKVIQQQPEAASRPATSLPTNKATDSQPTSQASRPSNNNDYTPDTSPHINSHEHQPYFDNNNQPEPIKPAVTILGTNNFTQGNAQPPSTNPHVDRTWQQPINKHASAAHHPISTDATKTQGAIHTPQFATVHASGNHGLDVTAPIPTGLGLKIGMWILNFFTLAVATIDPRWTRFIGKLLRLFGIA